MRPTIGEQLAGTCRILEDVVAPEVAGAQAADALRGLVKNLRMLETSWAAVLPFLHWDNAQTTALLRRARPAVPAVLAERITSVCDALASDPVDVTAVQEHNDRLRGVLSEVVAVLDTGSETYRAIAAYLNVRASRYPLRMVPDTPAAAEGRD
jgi:hypothetical protein